MTMTNKKARHNYNRTNLELATRIITDEKKVKARSPTASIVDMAALISMLPSISNPPVLGNLPRRTPG